MRFGWPFARKSDAGVTTQSSAGMEALRAFLLGQSTKSGQKVNVETALKVTTVLACVRSIANGVAQVPLNLYVQTPGQRSKLVAKDHPLYFLLHRKPNEWQTSFEFREMLIFHAMLTRGFFAFINRVRGEIVELIPFDPGMVSTKRAEFDAPIVYTVTFKSGKQQDFPAEAIWHVKGPSWNTAEALDAVRLTREAIGLAMATEERHAHMHKNGVMPSGVYSVEGNLDAKGYKDLRQFIAENYTGAEAGLPMILDRGAKWLQHQMTGVDAEHLKTREHQVKEICRGLGVMPIMVYETAGTIAYQSAEQMFLAHVVHDLAPWYERIEQSIDIKLLTAEDRKAGRYAKFVIAGLLRGALKDTAEFIYRLVSIGVLTPNEGREKLELNPLDGGDVPLTPINWRVVSGPTPEETSGAKP
jgi:HK97 family phage portal protein